MFHFGRKVALFFAAAVFAFVVLSPIVARAETLPCPAPVQETSAPAEVPAAVETPAAPSFRVSLNEILPDPVGKDTDGEFIELAVSGSGTLAGWSVADAHGKTFIFPDQAVSDNALGFAYSTTKIALPNDGGSLILKNPNGEQVDHVEYVSPVKEGSSFARNADGTWAWTTLPTPAGANAFPTPPVPAASAPPTTPPGTTTETAAVQTTPIAAPLPKLRLSELLPNPIGDDATEWIEIANEDVVDAELAGWSLTDRTSGRFVFGHEIIPAGGVIIVTKSVSKISLNNDGDDVSLVSPDGKTADTTTYGAGAEGSSWSRMNTDWRWSNLPTPGQRENVEIIAKIEENTEVSATAEMTVETPPKKPEDAPVVSAELDELSDIDDDSLVEVTATVSVALGPLGKRTFAMQTENAAAIVRMRGTQTFIIAAGDVVQLRGKVSHRGHETILSAVVKDFKKIGRAKIEPSERDVDGIAADDAGLMATIEGKISHRTKRAIFLTDDGGRGELRVNLPTTSTAAMEIGSMARVTGIIRFSKETPEITVIDRGDVAVTAAPTIVKHDDPAPQTLVLSSNERRSEHALVAAAVVGATCAACLAAYWFRRKSIVESGG